MLKVKGVFIGVIGFFWGLFTCNVPLKENLHVKFIDDSGNSTAVMLGIQRIIGDKEENVVFGEYTLLVEEKEKIHLDHINYNRRSNRFQWHGKIPHDVDGQISIRLDTGKYRLVISKGIEYFPQEKIIQIKTNNQLNLTFQLKRFVDMPALGWWSGDTHVHCTRKTLSKNKVIFTSAMAEDIHVTNVLLMGDDLKTYFSQYALGNKGIAVNSNYCIVPGQEEPRTHTLGHLVGLHINHLVRNEQQYMRYDMVLKGLRDQGALTGMAHIVGNVPSSDLPANQIDLGNDLGLALLIPDSLLDFIEVLDAANTFKPNKYFDFLNMGFKLPLSAGSDFPYGPHIGDQRVYVFLGEKTLNPIDHWFKGFKDGHSFVTQGPLIEFFINDQIPGSLIKMPKPEDIRVQYKVYGLADIGMPKTIKLIKHGKILKQYINEDINKSIITGDWLVTVNESSWYTLLVEAFNGAIALTAPIYVSVDNKPTWDREQLLSLIDKYKNRLAKFRMALSEENILKRLNAYEKISLSNPYFPKIILDEGIREIKLLQKDSVYLNNQIDRLLKEYSRFKLQKEEH